MTATEHGWRARLALVGSTVLVTTLTNALAGEETRATTRGEEPFRATPAVDSRPAAATVSAPTVKEATPHSDVRSGDADRGAAKADPLPLGRTGLPETRRVRALDEGVTLTVIRRGKVPRRGKQNNRPEGPWTVRAVTIDPARAAGRLSTTYGPTLADTEPTTALTRGAAALVGINASFFSMTAAKHQGVPAGLTLAGGRVLSEPSGYQNEVTLVVDSVNNRLRMGSFDWSAEVRSRNTSERMGLDQVNRAPHVPQGCRNARQHRRCTKPGQLAAFTSDFARKTPSGVGTEVVLNGKGCPIDVREKRGVRLTGRQKSLQATGRAASTMLRLVADGCLAMVHHLQDGAGEDVQLGAGTSAVTGRYRLLSAGKIVMPARSGGFFGRNPRTIAGTTKDGLIMFVTIDGRHRSSVGATMREAARVAKALGMRNAVNLDGGGSTTLAVRGELANRPAGAERPVSDALVWIARRR